MKKLIYNALTITMNGENQIGRMSVLIDGKIISEVYSEEQNERALKDAGSEAVVIDASDRILLPGFINAHIHADMLLAKGLGDGFSLHEQGGDSLSGRNNWFVSELSSENRNIGRELQYIESLRSGTTYICDFLFWTDREQEVCRPFKKTGIDGAAVIDYRSSFLSGQRRSIKELEHIFNEIREGGYTPLLQGPSEESFDDDVLNDLKSLSAEYDVKLMLHLAETKDRVEIIKRKFGLTPVNYLHKIGFLSSNIIGSHGVYVDDNEMDIIAEKGVTIVNSPTAEMKIADGIAPVCRLIKKSIPIGLGTDGALWNDSANMFAEMKTLMLLQRVANGAGAFSAYQALEAATIGGARALGIDSLYGSIEKNKRASMCLINPFSSNLVPVYNGRPGNLIENIISCGQPSDIETVIVNGDVVMDQCEFVNFDEMSIIKEAQKLGEKLFTGLK